MDEAVIIKRLESVVKDIRCKNNQMIGDMDLRDEIEALEDLISDLDTNWNGSHPVGQS